MSIKCEICGKTPMKNSVICSEKCKAVRLRIMEIGNKYFPTYGCDNCWGDLHEGCTEQCKKEFRESGEFGKDLWSIIRLIFPKEKQL